MNDLNQIKQYSGKDIMFIWMFIITIGAVIFAIYSFNKVQNAEPDQEQTSQVTATTKAFYTNAVTNVRGCASTSCDVVGTFTINHELSLPYGAYSDLPEWIEVSPKDTNGSDVGYIHKSTLGTGDVEISSQNSVSTETKSKSELIKKWSAQTGFLTCYSSVGGEYIPIQTASVYVHKFASGGVRGLTNKHAIQNMYGGLLSGCSIDIPGIYYDVSTEMIAHPTYDVAQIVLPESEFTRNLQREDNVCYKENITPELGDEVLILGYPGIGDNNLTVTEGIISGVGYPYFTTSAKIDQGNSGGVAILVDHDCFLGIPTGSVVGEIESLGRILDISVFGS